MSKITETMKLDAVDLAELYRDDRQRNPVTAARGSTRHAAGPAPGGAHQLLDDGVHQDLRRGLDARPYRYGKGNRGNGSGAGEREERTAWNVAKAADPVKASILAAIRGRRPV